MVAALRALSWLYVPLMVFLAVDTYSLGYVSVFVVALAKFGFVGAVLVSGGYCALAVVVMRWLRSLRWSWR